MKNLKENRVSGQDQKFGEILANIVNIVVLLSKLNFTQNICSILNIKQYITLAELSQLYCGVFKERREELRPLLDQIATDFAGWLEFFNKKHFDCSFKEISPMVINELILSARTFAQKQKLYNLNLEKRSQILDSMKIDARNWDELLFLLTQGEFDKKIYKKALHLAGKDKEKLLSLLGLRSINNYRRAHLCCCLLKIKHLLSSQNLITIYRRLDEKSKMRLRVAAILKSRKEDFTFWLAIYQSEHGFTWLKEISLRKMVRIKITPEKIIHTGNDNCEDKSLVGLMAKKLEKIDINPLYLDNLYKMTTHYAPEIREIILEKKRLAISLDDNLQDPLRFTALRDLFAKSSYNPEVSEKILMDIITSSLTPGAAMRSIKLNFIKSSLNKTNTRSLKKLISLLAPKIKSHDEWIDLSIHCKNFTLLYKLIIKEYKKFFIKDFLSQSPSPGTNRSDFRNREIKKIWDLKLQVA
jgi:hypothetical protein